jgi:hypothetical protein
MEQASALLVYLSPNHFDHLQTGNQEGRVLDWQGVPNGSAGTFAGSVRRVIEGNCCCYYLDCCTHCCWGWHTEPCPRGDLDSACRTEEQCCCQRLQVGTRWEGVGDVEGAGQGRRPPVASVRRQALQEHHPRERAAARRPGDALRQPCARLPLPSSSLSIPFGFP